MRSYFRWTTDQSAGPPNLRVFSADWIGSRWRVLADQTTGIVILVVPDEVDADVVRSVELDADTARMIGVRLIEAAGLADVDAIRAR